MAGRGQIIQSSQFEDVRRRFEARRRRRRGRFPEELWSAAVELAGVHGISRVARALRLDYTGLKRRVQASRGSGPEEGSEGRPTFVEVELPSVVASAQSLVRIEDGAGSSLTVQIPAACAGELASVARALWSSRS